MTTPTPKKTQPVPAETAAESTYGPEKKPHNPFAFVGTADWGKGGCFVVGKDGIRRQTDKPATPREE